MNELYEYLNKCPVAHLATVDSEGKPHNRAWDAGMVIDGKIWYCTANVKKVYEQIKANPYIVDSEKACYLKMIAEL